jgi:PRD1 phage membrane DNA delivery
MSEIEKALTGIVTAIIGIAILSVIVSNKANTSGVIQSAASGFGNILAVATSPVSGTSVTPNLSYSGSSGGSTSINLSGLGSLGNLGSLGSSDADWDNNSV